MNELQELATKLRKEITDMINDDRQVDVLDVMKAAPNDKFYLGNVSKVTIWRSRKRVHATITYHGITETTRKMVEDEISEVFGIDDVLHKIKYHPKCVRYDTNGWFDRLYTIIIEMGK